MKKYIREGEKIPLGYSNVMYRPELDAVEVLPVVIAQIKRLFLHMARKTKWFNYEIEAGKAIREAYKKGQEDGREDIYKVIRSNQFLCGMYDVVEIEQQRSSRNVNNY